MVEAVASQLGPDLITVTTSVRGGLDSVVRQLAALAEHWPLAIGGRGTDPRLASLCNARHLDDDPVTAAASIAVARSL
jgi:hypothetical protein